MVRFGAVIFLAVFVPFTILTAVGYVLYYDPGLMNKGVAAVSVLVSVVVNLFVLALWFMSQKADKPDAWQARYFNVATFIVALIISISWIVHLHIAGSQSSPILMTVFLTFFVFTHFLTWIEAVLLFVIGHAILVLTTYLEYKGVLPYLPMAVNGEQFGEVFLNWRVILLNTLTYMIAILMAGIILFSFRKKLEKKNRELKEQVEIRKRAQKETEKALSDLKKMVAHANRLEGLLPICSSCKNIRDREGNWHKLESYISNYSDVKFTHGLCPDCVSRLYPDLEL